MSRIITSVLMALFILSSVPATADEKGDVFLKKMEDVMNGPKDQYSISKMILKSKDGTTKERKFAMYQLGGDQRMIKFLEPAEEKGVAFLVLSSTEMYIYMPSFGKITRISSSMGNDSFMDSDMTNDDIGEMNYTDRLTATIVKEDDKTIHLKCLAKDGKEYEYDRMEIVLDKASNFPNMITFYDKKDPKKKVKTMDFVKVKKIGSYYMMEKLVVTTVATGHQTIMESDVMKVDVGLKKGDFKKNKMKRKAKEY